MNIGAIVEEIMKEAIAVSASVRQLSEMFAGEIRATGRATQVSRRTIGELVISRSIAEDKGRPPMIRNQSMIGAIAEETHSTWMFAGK